MAAKKRRKPARKKNECTALILHPKFRKTEAVDVGGRPRKLIDQDAFEELCLNQSPLKSITLILKCSDDTINRWCKTTYQDTFAAVYKRFGELRKSELRSVAHQVAVGKFLYTDPVKKVTAYLPPSPQMLKFLSKNRLGMQENPLPQQDQNIVIKPVFEDELFSAMPVSFVDTVPDAADAFNEKSESLGSVISDEEDIKDMSLPENQQDSSEVIEGEIDFGEEDYF